MIILADRLKEWFGYTRRERRSAFFLLVIIVIIIVFRTIVPERSVPVTVIPVSYTDSTTERPGARPVLSDSGLKSKRNQPVKERRRLIDINNCDSALLSTLPGIGPVLSARIVKYRKLLGGYACIAQLREVYGLSEETFNLISPMITADSSDVARIKINKADFRELLRHPYFEKDEVQAIMKYREFQGLIVNREDLIRNKLVPLEKIRKITPYIDFAAD